MELRHWKCLWIFDIGRLPRTTEIIIVHHTLRKQMAINYPQHKNHQWINNAPLNLELGILKVQMRIKHLNLRILILGHLNLVFRVAQGYFLFAFF